LFVIVCFVFVDLKWDKSFKSFKELESQLKHDQMQNLCKCTEGVVAKLSQREVKHVPDSPKRNAPQVLLLPESSRDFIIGHKELKESNKGKHFTLSSLSYHFSPFENENYHPFIISLQTNNLTSLSPYASDFTSYR
jgi:hypothetical protein